MQAEYEHSVLNVFQVMITNSRVDTRVDVSEQTNGQTNVRKLAHLAQQKLIISYCVYVVCLVYQMTIRYTGKLPSKL